MDGGFIWADMESASNDSLTVTDAQWQVPTQERRAPHNSSLSIAITTFNRPSYCLNQLQTIAAEKNLRDHLDTIYCVDQGTDRVQDQPDFQQTRELLGQQLTYILQDNLGGSGGFSRGMYETVRAQKSAYVLLLDDDAITEPEAILRAFSFPITLPDQFSLVVECCIWTIELYCTLPASALTQALQCQHQPPAHITIMILL